MEKKIPIDSYVAMIAGDDSYSGASLFSKKEKKKYVIPVYQRPYSWNETNIDDFLHTIIDGFYKNEMKFFGTMQFNVDKVNDKSIRYQIVDGQQRMTTMLLFVRLLDILSGRNAIEEYGFCIFSDTSSNADNILNEVIKKDEIGDIARGKKGKADLANLESVYDANIRMLNNKFYDYFKDCKIAECNSIEIFSSKVLDYVLSSLYVVILETDSSQMRLPEIVDVFNTINTTGLALDDSDIFKLQYFDYLNHTYPDIGDGWMDKLKGCYDLIDQFNVGKPNKKKIGISWVLDIYKHIICAKYNLKFKELSKSNERFFDDLFKKPDLYKDTLQFSEFSKVTEIFVDFWTKMEENRFTNNILWSLTVQLIDYTRYGRYWTVPFVYAYFHMDQCLTDETKDDIYNKALENSYAVARLFIVNSVNFAKVINPVQSMMCNDILPMISRREDVIQYVNNNIWESPYAGDPRGEFKGKAWFIDNLEKDTFNNSKVGLLCLLIAIKREMEVGSSIDKIKDLLFNPDVNPYDIEHIYSRSKFMEESLVPKEDRPVYNAIGNLVILEREINRAMGRNYALFPAQKDKPEYYHKTNYTVAKDVIQNLKSWGKNEIVSREKAEEQLLIDLLSIN